MPETRTRLWRLIDLWDHNIVQCGLEAACYFHAIIVVAVPVKSQSRAVIDNHRQDSRDSTAQSSQGEVLDHGRRAGMRVVRPVVAESASIGSSYEIAKSKGSRCPSNLETFGRRTSPSYNLGARSKQQEPLPANAVSTASLVRVHRESVGASGRRRKQEVERHVHVHVFRVRPSCFRFLGEARADGAPKRLGHQVSRSMSDGADGLRGDKCCGGAISLEEHGLSQSKHKRVQIRGENLGGVAGGKRELSIDAPNIRLQSASLKSTTRTYDAPKLDVSWTARLLVGSTGEGRKKTVSKSIARSSGEHVE
ncbi:hypothetical protein C8R44DRAFT_747763 [Mycena epipterygia]|nr:hypothetical protein C8R44DRAFT_747763 [Mycena epipterygia]